MTFIETVSEQEASGAVKDAYEADRSRLGYVANYSKVFAQRPSVYAAWKSLSAAIQESMDPRRYELVTLAAARQIRSSYCSLAHGKVLMDRFLEPMTVRDVVLDHRSADLTEVDVAVMDLGAKVADDATSVTQADIDDLRGLGLSDSEIFDIVVTAAARCFFSKTLDGTGTRADAVYAELEPELRNALTVGRPIDH
jgi:uncharacterized peroxidase-related enzyme